MTGEASSPSISTSAPEQAARNYDVQFERVLSFRPQIAAEIYGREPPLRDLIFNYYASSSATRERADELTKEYIHRLWQANLMR